ncbi:probable nucleoredoxin 2 isoform X2 [Salvia hispanica]|uniref:probable nucleoredoxin 2 isoform X2 n=1 Tax=Salvia hispanica TaxID=49212 RepID=UPI0020094F10|nr:probable nucleoredoxin 2 isoform X2 [Salvia hispanica]
MSSSKLLSLLASKDRDFLLSPTGTRVNISYLEGKTIGIYFSANWYQPCRNFTPLLANAYEQLKDRGPGFEVVFVSCDEDAPAFDEHRALMPWLAIPFSGLETKRSLNTRFGIEDIPSLIILQPAYGRQDFTILNGVDLIYRHGVQAYPFSKLRAEELLHEETEKRENQTLERLLSNHDTDYILSHTTSKQVPVASLIGKTIGLYFSAQWCIPGAKFTPKLASIYRKINEEVTTNSSHDFEIVYLSSDHDQSAFDSYFNTMPWMAMSYGHPNIKSLAKYFDVEGIPSLVILGPDGKTVTKRGRSLINLYQEKAYPFTEARIEVLKRQVDEESMNLPESERHSGHCHELLLVSEGTGGGPFICCDCDEQGFGWAYQCIECGYEVHPKCVRSVEP